DHRDLHSFPTRRSSDLELLALDAWHLDDIREPKDGVRFGDRDRADVDRRLRIALAFAAGGDDAEPRQHPVDLVEEAHTGRRELEHPPSAAPLWDHRAVTSP